MRNYLEAAAAALVLVVAVMAGVIHGFVAAKRDAAILSRIQAAEIGNGMPVKHANLPDGHYTVVAVIDKRPVDGLAIVKKSTPQGDIFVFVRDLPLGMLVEGYTFRSTRAD